MWGCSYFSNFSGLGRILPIVLIAVLGTAALVLLIVRVIVRRNKAVSAGKSVHRDQTDSIKILGIRYARGEVDKAEYLRMKKMLKQSGQ